MNDAAETAQKISLFSDRALFIFVIGALAVAIVWMVRYVITRMEAMVEKNHEVATSVAVAVAGNTTTVARNTEALDNNSSVVKDCQTELVRCREHFRESA